MQGIFRSHGSTPQVQLSSCGNRVIVFSQSVSRQQVRVLKLIPVTSRWDCLQLLQQSTQREHSTQNSELLCCEKTHKRDRHKRTHIAWSTHTLDKVRQAFRFVMGTFFLWGLNPALQLQKSRPMQPWVRPGLCAGGIQAGVCWMHMGGERCCDGEHRVRKQVMCTYMCSAATPSLPTTGTRESECAWGILVWYCSLLQMHLLYLIRMIQFGRSSWKQCSLVQFA